MSDATEDRTPVLLWVWRHFTLYVHEHRSLSEAAWAAQGESDGDTGSAAGAEVGGEWYDRDALFDLWYTEFSERERQPRPVEPRPAARVTVDPPSQLADKGNEDGWTFMDINAARSTYERLRAAYGDRVHLVEL